MFDQAAEQQISEDVREILTAYQSLARTCNYEYPTISLKKHEQALRILAVELRTMQASPWLFITWLHGYFGHDGKQIFANWFLSRGVLGNILKEFKKALPDERKNIRIRLQASAVQFQIELGRGRELREILLDEETQVHIVMRYWIAKKQNLSDVVAALETTASRIMQREPEYLKAVEEALCSNQA